MGCGPARPGGRPRTHCPTRAHGPAARSRCPVRARAPAPSGCRARETSADGAASARSAPPARPVRSRGRAGAQRAGGRCAWPRRRQQPTGGWSDPNAGGMAPLGGPASSADPADPAPPAGPSGPDAARRPSQPDATRWPAAFRRSGAFGGSRVPGGSGPAEASNAGWPCASGGPAAARAAVAFRGRVRATGAAAVGEPGGPATHSAGNSGGQRTAGRTGPPAGPCPRGHAPVRGPRKRQPALAPVALLRPAYLGYRAAAGRARVLTRVFPRAGRGRGQFTGRAGR